MKIKLCGIRRPCDIDYVNHFMPDYIGFIFAPNSPRTITPEFAADICQNLNPHIKKVGVFVNQSVDFISNTASIVKLDVCQLHGNENFQYITELNKNINVDVWKAVRVANINDILYADKLNVSTLLLDSFSSKSHGGTGKTADWNIIANAEITKPFFLAGGLNELNLIDAINQTNPYGVDISSGIETDGFKDYNKIKTVMQIIKNMK